MAIGLVFAQAWPLPRPGLCPGLAFAQAFAQAWPLPRPGLCPGLAFAQAWPLPRPGLCPGLARPGFSKAWLYHDFGPPPWASMVSPPHSIFNEHINNHGPTDMVEAEEQTIRQSQAR